MDKNTINNKSTTLITAIYGYGPDSVYGGRGRNIYFYNSVLRAIALMDLPIIIYANQDSIENIEHYVKSYLTNYKIIPYELNEFIYSEEILKQKEENREHLGLNDRNHILCYNKLYWLNDAADKNYFNTEKFLWIDCGLFHHGIIPERVGGVELSPNILPNIYYPEHEGSIFNPTLGLKIDKIIEPDKILACAHPAMGDLDTLIRITREVLGVPVPYVGHHVVGGMFGGYKDTIKRFLKEFEKLLIYSINHKHLYLEEPLFSCVAAAMPEMFNLQHFYYWYYYSPGERCSYMAEDGDSFYKIFTRIYNS